MADRPRSARAASERRPWARRRRGQRALAWLAGLTSAGGVAAREASCDADSGSCAAPTGTSEGLAWQPRTLSVVLPCANEGDFAKKTIQAVSDSVPGGSGGDILSDIVVVDDASDPPLSKLLSPKFLKAHHVTLVQHTRTQGLIVSKSDGAAAAVGDIVVFFDCHVAPQPGWHAEFLKASAENYRRVVVPVITSLNIDTWTEEGKGMIPGLNKCYLTWDADFKWMVAEGPEIPVLSGGLLGISKRWWNETGGYDSGMRGWGGENIDQSVRTWLCGGEIHGLPNARVAHMWRVPSDPRTQATYQVNVMDVLRNRARAARGWFGEFAEKLEHYPDMRYAGNVAPGDLASFREVQERLRCRPFAWYIWRFGEIYHGAGLLPRETFRVRHVKTSKCLTYLGPGATHPQGRDKVALQPCGTSVARGRKWPNGPPDAQRFHLANWKQGTSECCSGLRVWSTDQCTYFMPKNGELGTSVCDLAGRQGAMKVTDGTEGLAPGQLMFSYGSGAQTMSWCVTKAKGGFKGGSCAKLSKDQKKMQRPVWDIIEPDVPVETRLYEKAMEEMPELFA
ncbi:unnamed protein product [Prorocentrum cordatum]|uniref:Glycosyltransferase 2-like domain-containing protein n=1 Tax=Prorocentrum cordatum TaxID=2364126 RepID=A0ABN9ULB5_9DINO|nr:unnamed protein product [Polarella glacialis]